MSVGIEAINVYGGRAVLDVRRLFEARGLDLSRFEGLMIKRKAVGFPWEDPVTNAVNAAKPIVDAMAPEDRERIELIITATESGIDFGKALSTYVHHYLGLSRRCRLFEVKQACYGGTAALQMAVNFVASGLSPGAKALVIATDVAGAAVKHTYVEPTQGVGAVAMIVGDRPAILELDLGANGYHSYEVMDTCRPTTEIETGDADLSLLSYLDCLEHCFGAYSARVEGADFVDTFDYLCFHTPFGGMVKGAHRMMLRKLKRQGPEAAEADFQRRLLPSFTHCWEIGNIYSATVYLALCGLIESGDFSVPRRIGLFSYGSGCSSEFYSGVVPAGAQERVRACRIGEALASRHALSMEEYDRVIEANLSWRFGLHDRQMDTTPFADLYAGQFDGRGLLVLRGAAANYQRQYAWS
jgi:polyketide biosynthesis 3-hydroxy-3-methylglutaryl-CoA synthase-like enzyme PksG